MCPRMCAPTMILCNVSYRIMQLKLHCLQLHSCFLIKSVANIVPKQRHFRLQKRTFHCTVVRVHKLMKRVIQYRFIIHWHTSCIPISYHRAAMVYKSFKGDSIGGKVLRGPSKVDSKKSQTRSRKGMMTALYMLLMCLCNDYTVYAVCMHMHHHTWT